MKWFTEQNILGFWLLFSGASFVEPRWFLELKVYFPVLLLVLLGWTGVKVRTK